MSEKEPYIAYCTCGKIMGLSPIPQTTRTCPECMQAMFPKWFNPKLKVRAPSGGAVSTTPCSPKESSDKP
jgi:hypothetical protein